MKFYFGLLVMTLFHAVHSGHVSVRMPFGSPAGVTYVDGAYHVGLTAGPLAYTAPAPALPLASAPVAPVAPVTASTYAAVPTVQHVPAVADVPITRYEAQPGVIQKVVDVAKPAVQTRRFEIRRPALQKEFYDVEERVVVRPAGSAVVELDEPVSRTQKGPAVIQPAAVAVPSFGVTVTPSPIIPAGIPAVQGPFISNPDIGSTPAPFPAPAPVSESHLPQQSFSDEDSISVENPDISLRSALSRSSGPSTPVPYPRYERPEPVPASLQFQARSQPQPRFFTAQQTSEISQSHESTQARAYESSQAFLAQRAYSSSSSNAPRILANTAAPQLFSPSHTALAPQTFSASEVAPAPQSYTSSQTLRSASRSASYVNPQNLFRQSTHSVATIPSIRDYQGPEVSQANQQRLIDLLTAREGVTEIGYGRSGGSISAGQVRGRVISATPAPVFRGTADERVNTRRVVVTRPIETLQEVEVAEPVTKLERIQVNQPTLIKTAKQDLLRVPTSVPVYGKTLAPVAPAALPLAYSAPHQPWQ